MNKHRLWLALGIACFLFVAAKNPKPTPLPEGAVTVCMYLPEQACVAMNVEGFILMNDGYASFVNKVNGIRIVTSMPLWFAEDFKQPSTRRKSNQGPPIVPRMEPDRSADGFNDFGAPKAPWEKN